MNLSSHRLLRFVGLFLIICHLGACTNRPSVNILDDEGIPTIRLHDSDLEQISKTTHLHDVFKSIKIIPLETSDSCLMGQLARLTVTPERFYCTGGANSIYIFDRNGRFIQRFNRHGRGPQEYTKLRDYTLLNGKDILILDNKKLIAYTPEGHCILTQTMPNYADRIEALDNQFIACHENSGDLLFIWDLAHQKVLHVLMEPDKKRQLSEFYPFTRWGNQLFFRAPYDDKVLKVFPHEAKCVWKFDYGERTINGDDDFAAYPEFYGAILGRPDKSYAKLFLETDRYVYLDVESLELSDYSYYVFYSKQTGTMRILHAEKFNPPMNIPSMKYTTEDGEFIETEDPVYLINQLKKLDEFLTDPEDHALLESMKAQMANVKPEDNPVICVYTLQDF